jgi:hypothetical protein
MTPLNFYELESQLYNWTLRFVFVSAEAFEADYAFLLVEFPDVYEGVALSLLFVKVPQYIDFFGC